jgi:hypothetical protein
MANTPAPGAAQPTAIDSLNAADERAVAAARAPAAPAGDVWGVEHCCVREFWAVVETNGTLVRGRNVAACRKIPGPPGIYEVHFTGNVSNGVFNATIGRPGISTEPPGEITVALRAGPGPFNPFTPNKGVWVQTWDSAGKPSDRAFHLMVHVQ